MLIPIKLITLDGLVLLIHVTLWPSGLRYLAVAQQFPSENRKPPPRIVGVTEFWASYVIVRIAENLPPEHSVFLSSSSE